MCMYCVLWMCIRTSVCSCALVFPLKCISQRQTRECSVVKPVLCVCVCANRNRQNRGNRTQAAVLLPLRGVASTQCSFVSPSAPVQLGMNTHTHTHTRTRTPTHTNNGDCVKFVSRVCHYKKQTCNSSKLNKQYVSGKRSEHMLSLTHAHLDNQTLL